MKMILACGTFAWLGLATAFGQFDAVSIRPSQPLGLQRGYDLSPGRIHGLNLSVKDLIAFAYGLQDYQVRGGPGWTDTEHYDFVGTFPGTTTDEERRKMMQSMLADRFALTIRRGSKEVSGYALVVAKDGPTLKKAGGGPPTMMGSRGPNGERTLEAKSAQMAGLARMLATILGQPVEEKTGLTGAFDFDMQWMPDETQSALGMRGKEAQIIPSDGTAGPSLFTALQKTLGLALKGQKTPMEVITIDSVERPSAN